MSDLDPSPTERMETPGSAAGAEPPAATAELPATPTTPAQPSPVAEPSTPAVAPPPSSPPSWHTPDRGNPGRTGSIIVGLILLVIGLWFFAEQTLGLELPTLRWDQLWPLILIALGGWIVLGQVRRGSR